MPIRVLPESLRREIAAGEVVTRPSDAVKELLENALDAGATRLEIELRDGGLELIRVTDDGVGIPEPEVELALERFATSKLERLTHIETLGFRGEALWSIAFAADLILTTRPKTQLGGVRFAVRGDDRVTTRVTCAAGTTVDVQHLFAKYPARRASLESPALEVRRVLSVVSKYVLHHPGKAWRVVVDDEVRLQHAPGAHRDAVANVYGAMTANRLLPLEFSADEIHVIGVISRPELARARRDRMHIAINDRPVELDDNLANAVLRGFGTLLPKHHAPMMAINLRVPPEGVNQNAHPGKLRVALLDAKRIESILQDAVAQALSAHPLAPNAPEPRVVTAPQPARSHFPELRFIGTYRDAYMLAEGEGDLWLLDQHAAHERILFEELEQRFNQAEALELETPELIPLSPDVALQLDTRRDELETWGFTIQPFGGGLYRITRVPAAVAGINLGTLVNTLLSALNAPDLRREFLARMACLPAIKAGHRLTRASAEKILEALRTCAVPWACPHGRPTALKIHERDLAHQFGRRGARDLPKEEPVRLESV